MLYCKEKVTNYTVVAAEVDLTLIFHNKQSWNAKVTSEEKELILNGSKNVLPLICMVFSEQKIKIYEENGNWWKKIEKNPFF